LDELLRKDPDVTDLLSSYHSNMNRVKMMRKVIEHYLKTEERAERFVKILHELEPRLCDDLKEHRPQGRFGEYNPHVE
jgi:NAD(P)H-nitrite reductase large subunit